ncbi:MAG: VOC family protein [Candidatus Cryptobacteroides sp.]
MAYKDKVICGIQQVGIGVDNVEKAWKWYNEVFGFSTKIFGDEGVAEKMLPYTGGKPQRRFAILVLNLMGGGGFEVWQPKGRELNWLAGQVELGDYGIDVCKVRCKDVQVAYNHIKSTGAEVLCPPCKSLLGKGHFFVKDLYGNLFEVEEDDYVFIDSQKPCGGVSGVVLGVSDMERSLEFYKKVLDFTEVEYDRTGVFEDLGCLPGGDLKMRRVLISRGGKMEGPLSEILGPAHIELVQRIMSDGVKTPSKIYANRLWGDPGFIHLCFDIRNMDKVGEAAGALGHNFVCDGGRDFKMGEANGHFTYVEDPDGTLIEFVETFRIPILKKFGIYLNLENRDDLKPLPRLISKALRFM